MSRPTGFEDSQAGDWDRWVLEHGLPDIVGMPLPVGHSVPIAVWRGPSTAAVLHLCRQPPDEPGCAPYVESDVALFARAGNRWVPAGGGGSGGTDLDVCRRADVDPRGVTEIEAETTSLDGAVQRTAVSGLVGTQAHTVEVELDGVVVRRPIEAPLGTFVVSSEGRRFTVRVRDDAGLVLGEQVIDVAERFGRWFG